VAGTEGRTGTAWISGTGSAVPPQPAARSGIDTGARVGGGPGTGPDMTVLSRLVDKGLVERIPDGRIIRFRAAGDPTS
jgi:hypothetical protein